MTVSTALKELEKRLSEARGPDREIDLEILKALGMTDPTAFYDKENDCLAWYEPHPEAPGCPSELCGDDLPKLTHSLDAAVSLCARVLPGANVSIYLDCGHAHSPYGKVRIGHDKIKNDDQEVVTDWVFSSPALALCLAVVRALIAKEKE